MVDDKPIQERIELAEGTVGITMPKFLSRDSIQELEWAFRAILKRYRLRMNAALIAEAHTKAEAEGVKS